MVTEFSVKKMLPLNLWSKQSAIQTAAAQASAAAAAESGVGAGAVPGNASLLAQMQLAGHPLAATPGFLPTSLFRPGEHASHGLYSYPALHPSFFRPHLDPAALGSLLTHRSMMAMQQHHGSGGDTTSPHGHPSAFTPAAKRLRIHEDGHSPRDGRSSHSPCRDRDSDHSGHGLVRDHDTSGSTSNRTSPLTPVHNVGRHNYSPASSLSGSHRINGGDILDPHLMHGAEDLRLKWRCDDGDNLRCPICKALLQPGEIRTHLYKEFASLKESLQSQTTKQLSNGEARCSVYHDNDSSKSRYDTFLRIRRNRENRLSKIRGDRKRKRYSDEMSNTSVVEHEETVTSEHHVVIPHPSSPRNEPVEEETVDVTSCEEPEVAIYTCSTSSREHSPVELKEDVDRNSSSRPSPYNDQQRST